MASSRIVVGEIGPITAHKIRLPGFANSNTKNLVDPEHPITAALMQQLPKLSLGDLMVLRDYVNNYSAKDSSMSKPEDIDSWIYMVEEEISYREKDSRNLLTAILSALNLKVKQ